MGKPMNGANLRTRGLSLLAFALMAVCWALMQPTTAKAQLPAEFGDDNNTGTLYYIAFPDTAMNRIDPRFPNNRVVAEANLWLWSPVANKVRITTDGGNTDVVSLEPGKFKVYQFKSNPIVTGINTILKKGIKVDADMPIVVYCYFTHYQATEAFTPIPVDNFGQLYYSASIPGETANEIGVADEVKIPHTPRPAPAEILVVAAFDNTKVTILPPAGIRFVGGPPTVITLNEGEVFQVQSRVDTSVDAETQDDIAATIIQADKPIGVVGGNTRAKKNVDDFGLKDNAYKNPMFEWIPPADQHGTKFLWMPTYDSRRMGSNAVAERHREFARIYNTTGAPNLEGFQMQPGGTKQNPFKIAKKDSLMEFSIGVAAGVYFETKGQAMVMMNSMAIIRQVSSTPTGFGVPAQEFEGWAPYMVEITPREQWVNFAPYYAPTNPGAMQSFINVVTDTITAKSVVRENGSTFLLNRKVPGTDLIWGTMNVSPGEDHWVYSKNKDGKLSGFVYGLFRGEEKYRPGGTRKKDDKKAVIAGGGGGGAVSVLHPCEFEEYSALSYGYPLAPSRRVLRPADSLQIDTVLDCTVLKIKIRALNANPVGLRSVTLEPSSVKNARLVAVDPPRLSDIVGKSRVELRVEPIDPLQNASATVIIKDRTGKIWKVYYTYEAEYVNVDPQPILDYGELTAKFTVTKTVTITNPLTRPVIVKELLLSLGTQGYKIVKSTPAVPATLAPGAKLLVEVSSTPEVDNQRYVDTLKVKLGCVNVLLPLVTETARPKVYVHDVDFGVFVLGVDNAPKTMPMTIENIGTGEIRFGNPGDPDPTKLVIWPDNRFSVDPNDIAALKDKVLKANEKIDIPVVFDPVAAGLGNYRTVARVFANTRDIRDTSVWTARVIQPGPKLTDYDWHERWVVTPLNTCTKNLDGSYVGEIIADNVGTSDDEVVSLTIEGDDAEYFAFDNSDPLKTIRPGDVLQKNSGKPLHQLVRFFPKDERPYEATVVLKAKVATTPIIATLKGIGIESHGEISGFDFGTVKFNGPSNPPAGTAPVPGTVTLRAKPTRDLTVTDIQILGDPANFYIDKAPLGLPWTLKPGQTKDIAVEFRPQVPGTRTAKIVFVGDHAFCDDSTNTLTGYSYTAGVETKGYNFGRVLTCDQPENAVLITNTGSEPLLLRGVTLTDPDGVFTLLTSGISFPVTLVPGTPLAIPVRFSPVAVKNYAGKVSFDVINPRDNSVAPAQDADVLGIGYTVQVPAAIARTYHGAPGTQVTTPIVLQDAGLDPVKVNDLVITLNYDRRVLKLLNASANPTDIASMTNGTLLNGWNVTVLQSNPGLYQIEAVAPANTYLNGTGELLRPQFQMFLGRVSLSELPFTVELKNKPCAWVNPEPGLVTVDSVCGINLRLIEAMGTTYTLDQNHPNPFNPSTDINFSLGLDGPTKLTVYDANGKLVATLIDAIMQPGTYRVTWNAAGFPSGLYYYRLESGMWTKTNTMMLRK